MIPYVKPGDAILGANRNAIFAALDAAMDTFLSGRSFILPFVSTGTATGNVNGQPNVTTYGGLPYSVFGKCFFFTQGRTTYAQYFPGFIPRDVSVADPITGIVSTVQGARNYDHTDFTNAPQTPTSFDDANRIANIPTVGDVSYVNGLRRLNGVAIFEHSLQAHYVTRATPSDGITRRYFLKEAGAPIPEKRYRFALAEIVIEGPSSIALPVEWDKYECFRFHNLSEHPCGVNLGGVNFTLQPFECQSWRRIWNPQIQAFEETGRVPYRYLQQFLSEHLTPLRYKVPADPTFIWFYGSIPSTIEPSIQGDTPWTAASGTQGNNVLNALVVYDWIQYLTAKTNFGWLDRDPHILCDQKDKYVGRLADNSPTVFAGKFPAITTPNSPRINTLDVIGNLLHHVGTVYRAKVSKTVNDPRNPLFKQVVFDTFQFPGYGQALIPLLQSKGLIVQRDTRGDLHITPDGSLPDFIELICTGTNFLKLFEFSTQHQFIRSTLQTLSGYSLEYKIFESQLHSSSQPFTAHQDVFGLESFTAGDVPNYRIHQRISRLAVNQRTYVDINNQTQTVNGPSLFTLEEAALNASVPIASIDTTSIADLLTLRYFGDPTLQSQSDAYVTYTTPGITLTPEGIVITFKEQVLASAPLPALLTPAYANQYGRIYILTTNDAGVKVWEIKHVIRFRTHGWGYGQQGRRNAAFYPPDHGRIDHGGFPHDVINADGQDFTFPIALTENGIKVLRRVEPTTDVKSPKLNENAGAGARFFHSGQGSNSLGSDSHNNLDALTQFEKNYQTFPWYQTWRTAIFSGNVDVQRNAGNASYLQMIRIASDHENGMAQAVNQLIPGQPLSWKCLRIVWGSRVMDFNRFYTWQQVWRAAPAPITAFGTVGDERDTNGNGNGMDASGMNQGWKQFFQTRGVPVAGEEALPASLAQFKNEKNQWRVVRTSATMRVSNCAYAGNRVVWYATQNATVQEYQRIYTGTVALGLGDFTLDAVQDGFVFPVNQIPILPQGVVVPAILSTNITPIDLRTVYNGVQFITLQSFRAFVESFGFKFAYAETLYPLKLDIAELPDALRPFDGLSNNGQSINTEIEARDFGPVTNPAPTDGDPNVIAAYNAINLSANQEHARITCRAIIFRLADTGETPDWKKSSAETIPLAFNRSGDRTQGNNRTGHGGSKVVFSRAIGFTFGPAAIGEATFQRLPPFYPTTLNERLPVGGESADNPLQAYVSTFNYGHNSDGPRMFAEFEPPGDPTKLQRAENFYRYVSSLEQRWYAVQVVASAGLNYNVQAYRVPEHLWAAVKDWWQQTPEQWLSSAFGFATAPPRSVPPTALPDTITCGNGITILKPDGEGQCRFLFLNA